MEEADYFSRIALVFGVTLGVFALSSLIIGAERKAKWFKKRTKYTLFTRRSIFGEFLHFGRPCTWEGALVFTGIFGFVFSFGYWYIFHY